MEVMCLLILMTGCVHAWRKALKEGPGYRGQYSVKLCRFVHSPIGFFAAVADIVIRKMSCWKWLTLDLTQESLEELMIRRSWYGKGDDFAVTLQRALLIAEPLFVSVSFPQLAWPKNDCSRPCSWVFFTASMPCLRWPQKQASTSGWATFWA